ncbi:hypothetical protein ACH5RR_016502 [Cinchona calisaya]|uniref:Transcription repressor n=1 Tax=Cinchona calisaya TaxID=153742 RepID=A0ABD3A1P5_9GENT
MKLPSIFKNNKETNQHPFTRQWPSCKQPKTLSFRADDNIFKTVNSIYFDPLDNSSESEENSGEESLEMIVRGVVGSSERLFFEPGGITSSILKESAKSSTTCSCDDHEIFPLKESVVLAMESEDPYLDFKKSMEEMVETNGLKDWESLEELLGWYLKMNGKMNHGFIVGAFVDLLVGLASSSNSASCEDHESSSFLSAASSSSSFSSSSSPASSLSPVGDQKEIGDEGDRIVELSSN